MYFFYSLIFVETLPASRARLIQRGAGRLPGGPVGIRKNSYGHSLATVIFNFTINYHIYFVRKYERVNESPLKLSDYVFSISRVYNYAFFFISI